MNRITFSKDGALRPATVVLVGLVLSAIAFALDTLIANAAPAGFGAPGEVPAFGAGKVLLASVPAVLGNTLGFYLSYRAYHPRALAKFFAPAARFFVAFTIPPSGACSPAAPSPPSPQPPSLKSSRLPSP